jgi:hypothetical protein
MRSVFYSVHKELYNDPRFFQKNDESELNFTYTSDMINSKQNKILQRNTSESPPYNFPLKFLG